jgi:regulator of RNase E activity RraA
VGTITDGAVRDIDEMTNAGFKAIARRFCVGHGYSVPVRWGIPVRVYGCEIKPGDLVHADKHGFIVVPEEDQEHLVEAAAFMDGNECLTTIRAARESAGKSMSAICDSLDEAGAQFARNTAAFKKSIGDRGRPASTKEG